MKKFIVLLLAAALSMVPLSACKKAENTPSSSDATITEPPSTPITLRFAWWGTQVRHDRTMAVCDLFTETYENVTIEPEFYPWDGYWDALAAQGAAKTLPDVIQMSTTYTLQYYESDLMLNLTPYVTAKVLDLTDVPDSTLSQGKFGPNNDLYYVNLGMNALMAVYDVQMAQNAGITIKDRYTWDDLYEWTKAVNAANVGATTKKGVYGSFFFQPGYLMRSQGTHLYGDVSATTLGFSDPENLAYFFRYYKKAIEEGLNPTPEEGAERSGATEDSFIASGDAWIAFTWSNIATAFVDACAGRQLAAIPYPLVPGKENEKPTFYQASQLVGVTSNTANPWFAVKLVDFLTNSVEANQILLAERGVPINSKVNEAIQPLLGEAPRMAAAFLNSITDFVSDPDRDPPYAGEVNALLQGAGGYEEKVAYGTMSPDDAAKAFVEEANKIIADKMK